MTEALPFPIPGRRPPVVKGFRAGTHRQTAPEDTLQQILPLLSQLGITRVANVTGLDFIGVPVVMVCRPNARSVAVSQGKGLTLAAAKVSGIMESLELHHAEEITLPLKLASLATMERQGRVVNVERLPLRKRCRFHRNLPILWIAGQDLLSGETTWVPFECVTMCSTLPLPTGSGCFLGTSNGLASGNDLLEAVSHAICELVERDATTLWRARGEDRTSERLVDLSTVDEPGCREVIDRCSAAGVRTLVWDITSDLGLPAFTALITEPDSLQPIRSTAVGYGCHAERGVALLRAVTEAVQSRLTFISGSRDDLFRREYEDSLKARESIERFHEMTRLQPALRFQEVPSQDEETFDEDVARHLNRLQSSGFDEVVVVDLTNPEIGIPVVRTIVPGLEGPDSDPDYVPGARARAAAREHQ